MKGYLIADRMLIPINFHPSKSRTLSFILMGKEKQSHHTHTPEKEDRKAKKEEKKRRKKEKQERKEKKREKKERKREAKDCKAKDTI